MQCVLPVIQFSEADLVSVRTTCLQVLRLQINEVDTSKAQGRATENIIHHCLQNCH